MTAPSLTLFYIVEPPDYQIMACMLLASIRQNFGPEVKAVGYCPEHRMGELDPAVLKAHAMAGAEVRPMKTEGMWDEPYPHGNKIVACLQKRETEFSAFVDSDVLFLEPNTPSALVKPGHVSCSMAASMQWGDHATWERIYAHFNMPVPEERLVLMRQKALGPVVPYFSAGFILFPEQAGPQGRFPDVWYDTARALDRDTDLPKRRPYLDQMTLPLAIQRAGLHWNILPEEEHYILGGQLRGKPLPKNRGIKTVHYRNFAVLRETGLMATGRAMQREEFGVAYIRNLNGAAAEEEEA